MLAVVVILPVPLITFDPSAASNVVTFELLYVAGKPDNCDALPNKYPALILPVVDIGLFAKAAKLAATFALP